MSIEITIPGPPMGKGRPRMGRFSVYTPQGTLDAEDKIKILCRKAYQGRPWEGPVGMSFDIVYPRPKRMPKDRSWPACKPDFDNVIKLVCDAMNGIMFKDDSRVVRGEWFKRYAIAGEEPHVLVKVCFLRPRHEGGYGGKA